MAENKKKRSNRRSPAPEKIPDFDDEDLEDMPSGLTKAELERYYIDKVVDLAKALPWKEIVLSGVFTYAWWKAYGQGKYPTKDDIVLGALYGFTIPDALQGGVAANAYAIAALSALGIGLIPKELPQAVIDSWMDGADIVQSLLNIASLGTLFNPPGDVPPDTNG